MWQPGVRRSLTCVGLGLLALGPGSLAYAQSIETFLPPSVPGFDTQEGVTVLTRLRPLYEEPGIRLGSFVVNGGLDESVGYDSNVTGINKGRGDGFVRTSPLISATSDWSRNRLGFSASLDNYSYFSLPNQNYTNVNVAVGGGYTIGRHDLNVGYSHLEMHERDTDIGAVVSSVPVSFSVDALRSDYTIDSGRFSFTPNVDVRHYQFGSAVNQGQTLNQDYRDRNVVTGGVTTRYSLSDQRGILFVVEGSTSQFLRTLQGTPKPNSETVLVLTGLDYQANGLWRYRLLVGGEIRQFESSAYGTHVAPVIEANVIYTPTELTTLTGLVRREIEDPQSELTGGYTLTTVGLVADHELRRNILLQGRGTFQSAEYLTGGTASTLNFSAGGGVSWLLNRRVRLSADYDFTRQNGGATTNGPPINLATVGLSGSSQLNTLTTGTFTRNLLFFGIHLRL